MGKAKKSEKANNPEIHEREFLWYAWTAVTNPFVAMCPVSCENERMGHRSQEESGEFEDMLDDTPVEDRVVEGIG